MTNQSDSKDVGPLKELTYGAISGMVGKFVEYPFDTIKVRLQSSSQLNKFSTFQTIKYTYVNEGLIKGFYTGIKAPLLGACLENAILFSSYNAALKFITTNSNTIGDSNNEKDLPLKYKCLSGGFSGFMASFILTPIELVKCQLQVSNLVNNYQNHGYNSTIKQIIKNDGIIGFWKGLSSTLLREVNGTAIWFGTYEAAGLYLLKTNINEDLGLLLSGATAGLVFNVTTFPIDTIKSNIQTNDILNKNNKANFFNTIKRLGFKNLYNGLGITVIRCIPANAVIFYCYELLKRHF